MMEEQTPPLPSPAQILTNYRDLRRPSSTSTVSPRRPPYPRSLTVMTIANDSVERYFRNRAHNRYPITAATTAAITAAAVTTALSCSGRNARAIQAHTNTAP